MDLTQSIILGFIQGITEWLPISSSGHLVLTQKFLNLKVPIFYDILLHIGTLIPVFFIFKKEIFSLLKAFFKFDRKSENFKMCIFILISTIITGVIGIAFLKFFESLFENTFAVGIGLIISGIFIFSSKFFKEKKKNINVMDAVIIGITQAIAIAPGISRSGMTISSGLMRGIDKKTIFTYSFLLSILTIIGAQIVEMRNVNTTELSYYNINILEIFAGVATSAIVGYAAIRFLFKVIIISEKFHLFSYYCFVIGFLVIILYFYGLI